MAAIPDNNIPPARDNICIADADAAARRRLADLIGSLGAEVRSVGSGAELLAATDAGTVCVICDVRLPDMSGDAVITALHARHHDLPVIIVADEGDVATAVSAMRAGALDFMEKSHADRLLVWHLRRLLAESHGDDVGGTD